MNTLLYFNKKKNSNNTPKSEPFKKFMNHLVMIGGAISIVYFSIPKNHQKLENLAFSTSLPALEIHSLNSSSNYVYLYEKDLNECNKIISETDISLKNIATDLNNSKLQEPKIEFVKSKNTTLEKKIEHYNRYSSNLKEMTENYLSFFEGYDTYSSQRIFETVKERERRIEKNRDWVMNKIKFLGRFLEEIYFASQRFEIPFYVAAGIFLVENNGRLDSYNPITDDAGIYQFQRNTAKGLGLTVNNEIDERFHPEKSINAAMKYLKSLYEEFGRWDLAMLAYNQGSKRVKELIKEYIKINYRHSLSLSQIKRDIVENYRINLYKLTNSESLKRKFSGFRNVGQYYVYNALAWNELFLKNMKEISYEHVNKLIMKYDTPISWHQLARKYMIDVDVLRKENPHIKNAYGVPPKIEVRIPLKKETKNLLNSYLNIVSTREL